MREVLLDLLDQSVCQDALDLRDPQDQLERKEHLVRKALRVLLVVMESRVQ